MMTKKEKAAMQAAIDRADMLAALRWTSPVEPDVEPPGCAGYSEGWRFNEHTRVVEIGWSTGVSNGFGPAPKGEGRRSSGSHHSTRLYSTKARALAAMRHVLERKYATELMSVDRAIRAEAESVAPAKARKGSDQ